MPDLPSVTNFINSPPGQLAAGAALAGIVWKFFERVEAVLTDQTKHEVARWLRVRSADAALIADPVVPWPDTFARLFDTVFGERHLTLRCFLRSSIFSVLIVFLWLLVTPLLYRKGTVRIFDIGFTFAVLLSLVTNVVPDYVSLLETRLMISYARRNPDWRHYIFLLLVDAVITTMIAILGIAIGYSALGSAVVSWEAGWSWSDFFYGYRGVVAHLLADPWRMMRPVLLGNGPSGGQTIKGAYFLAAFFTSIWLWLYVGSGFLLKALGHFDAAFERFNKICDIEKHPLNAIGLVAGSLVALFYWAWAVFRHFVPV